MTDWLVPTFISNSSLINTFWLSTLPESTWSSWITQPPHSIPPSDIPPSFSASPSTQPLGKILRRVALIRGNDLSIHELLVAVGGVNNHLPIRDSQSLETIVLSKLTAPAAADGVRAAFDVIVTSARSWVAANGIGAWCCRRGVRVDGVGVIAWCVGTVAGAHEGFDHPLGRGGSHHRFFSGWSREDWESSSHSGDEKSLEMHTVCVELDESGDHFWRGSVRSRCSCGSCLRLLWRWECDDSYSLRSARDHVFRPCSLKGLWSIVIFSWRPYSEIPTRTARSRAVTPGVSMIRINFAVLIRIRWYWIPERTG